MLEFLRSVDWQGLANAAQEYSGLTVGEWIGWLVVAAVSINAGYATYLVLKRPVMIGWMFASFMAWLISGAARQGLSLVSAPVKRLLRRSPPSALATAIKSALSSDRLRYYESDDLSAERILIHGEPGDEDHPFVAFFCADGPLNTIAVNGKGVDGLLSGRERKAIARLARKRADALRTTEAEAHRELLTGYLFATLAPSEPPRYALRGGTNGESVSNQLARATQAFERATQAAFRRG